MRRHRLVLNEMAAARPPFRFADVLAAQAASSRIVYQFQALVDKPKIR